VKLLRSLYDRPYLLLCLTALFWGGNIVVSRGFAAELPPVTLSLIRWGGAFLLALAIARPHLAADWPAIKAHWLILLTLGVTGIGAYNTMAYTGIRNTEALNALLMQSSGPIVTMVWAFALFREPPTRWQVLGIALSTAGVITIATHGEWARLASLAINVGDAWVVAAMAVYGFYAAYLPKRPKLHWTSFLAVSIGIGALCQIPLLPIERAYGLSATYTPGSVAALVYIVIFPAFFAYICFNRGVELVGPNRTAPFFHLIPVFGTALAVVFLGERLQAFHLTGYALVISGVWVAARR
jgi:drug/metabolite transporter (DMT)-like permease